MSGGGGSSGFYFSKKIMLEGNVTLSVTIGGGGSVSLYVNYNNYNNELL